MSEKTENYNYSGLSEVWSETLEWAEKEELNIIPIQNKQKTPLISWKPYQKKLSTINQRVNWFKNSSNNVAVIGGSISDNLVIIDVDDLDFAKKLITVLPRSLTVRSSKGFHFYYKDKNHAIPKSRVEFENDKKLVGVDIQGEGSYVLCPPSIHPSGVPYSYIIRNPIIRVDYNEICELIHKTALDLKYEPKIKIKKHPRKQLEKSHFLEDFLPPIEEMVGFEGNGSHPVHGSDTGSNLAVNKDDQTWYCFRCQAGGSKLQWFAVKEGLIDCNEASSMNSEQYHKIFNRIEEEYQDRIPKDYHKMRKINQKISKDIEYIPKDFYCLIRENVDDSDLSLEFQELQELVIRKMRKKKPDKQGAYVDVANFLVNNLHFASLVDTKEILWYNPETGIYQYSAEVLIARIMMNIFSRFSVNCINETIDKIRRLTYIQRDMFNFGYKLACKNCVIDLNDLSIHEHSPFYYLTKQIPVNYDINAKCPKIDKFFNEVVVKPEILFEIVGYCLCPGYPIQKAIMLTGSGSNGKSTFLDLLGKFLGHDNVSSKELQRLVTGEFDLVDLYGKLANIAADLPSKGLTSTGIFKALTGGDYVTANVKHKGSIQFKNEAKLVFSCNEIPVSKYDDTDAYYRRWLIQKFPHQFRGKGAVKNLVNQLATPEELSGLLNIALTKLKEILLQGGFSLDDSDFEQLRQDYILLSDNLKAFSYLHLVDDPLNSIPKHELFTFYQDFCIQKNTTPKSYNVFCRDMRNHVKGLESRTETIKGERTPVFVGLTFIEDKTKFNPKKIPTVEDQKDAGPSNSGLEKHLIKGVEDVEDVEDTSTCGDLGKINKNNIQETHSTENASPSSTPSTGVYKDFSKNSSFPLNGVEQSSDPRHQSSFRDKQLIEQLHHFIHDKNCEKGIFIGKIREQFLAYDFNKIDYDLKKLREVGKICELPEQCWKFLTW